MGPFGGTSRDSINPTEFEEQAMLALPRVRKIGSTKTGKRRPKSLAENIGRYPREHACADRYQVIGKVIVGVVQSRMMLSRA